MATQIRVVSQDDGRIVFLDLAESQPLTANYQFKDIQDFKSTKGDHTFNFRVPSTYNNNLFFNQYFEVTQHGNFNPKLKVEATILKDSIAVLEGYLQLTNVIALNDNEFSYECVVFSSVATIGQVLDGKYLKEFDWSDYLHTMTLSNVVDSFDQDLLGGDIVYSLYDYGTSPMYGGALDGSSFEEDNAINVRTLRPQIRLKTLLTEIFNQSGFTFASTFLDTKDDIYVDINAGSGGVNAVNWNYYEVQASGDDDQQINATNGWHTIINSSTTDTFGTNEAGLYNTATGIYTKPTSPFDMVLCDVGITIKGSASPDTTTNAPLTGSSMQLHLIDPDGNIAESGGVTTLTWSMQDFNGTGYYHEQTLYFPSTTFPTMTSGDWKFVLEITNSDDASVTIDFTWGMTKFRPLQGISALTNTAIDFQADMVFDLDRNFPNIKALDLLTSVAKKFNLVIIPDETSPTHLFIEPYSDWIEGGNIVDWTEKLDVSKDIQYKPTADLQAKSLVFTDDESADNMNTIFNQTAGRIYGSRLIDNTSNDFGKDKEEIKTIFKPVITTYIPYTGIRSCVCYTGEGEDIIIEPAMRISFYSGQIASDVNLEKLWFTDGLPTTTPVELSTFPLLQNYELAVVVPETECLTFAGEGTGQLGYPTSLNGAYTTYWSAFLDETYSSEARIMTGTFFLSALDIMTMNFNDKIFVKNEYFRINKISSYPLVGSGTCKVELVKVSKTNAVFNDVICNVEPTYISYSGFVVFVNTETGALELPSQDCCEGYGYFYSTSTSGCWSISNVPNDPTSTTPQVFGLTELKPANLSNGIYTTTRGKGNVGSDFSTIVGVRNVVKSTSRSISINGNRNQVDGIVEGSDIIGNYNSLNPYSLHHTGSGYNVYARQVLKNITMRGDYGIAIASGDNFVSTGADPLYEKVGRGGSGHFVRAFTTISGSSEVVYIGQNGAFTPSTGTADEVLANQTENFFRVPYPSMMTFEARINAVNRGTTADRSQLYSNRIYQGRINNTTDLLGVSSDLNDVSPKHQESTAFTTMKFEVQNGQGAFAGNDVLCDGMFVFKIDTSDATSFDTTDFTIDIKYTLVGMQNMDRPATPTKYDPTDISYCKLWLDGADLSTITETSGNVSQWDDKSGNGYNFTKPTQAGTPSLSNIGALNCLDFDMGLDDALYNTDSNLYMTTWLGNSTWFVVFKSDTDTAPTSYGNQMVGTAYTTGLMFAGINVNASAFGAGGNDSTNFWNDTNDYSAYVDDIPVTQAQVVCGYRDGTTQAIIDQDGNTASNTSSAGVFANHTFVGGAVKSSNGKIQHPYDGKIGEVIMYSRKLTTTEIDEVMNYLKTKWNT